MLELIPVDSEEVRQAASGGRALPLEQTGVWARFAEAEGTPAWGSLILKEDGRPLAVVTLYRHEMGGIPYLWARRGPVWLREATPERERQFRELLADQIRLTSPEIRFVRLHATYAAADLQEPLRVIGYDRTVIIDGAGGDQAEALARLPKEGRRTVNRAIKKMAQMKGTIGVESPESFSEYYQLLVDTGRRDCFTPHPEAHYWNFLTLLGDNARLYVARVDGELAAWDLVGINGEVGSAFYGASSDLSRQAQAVPALDFEVARSLGEEGMVGLDLMGIHSPRTPELFGVGKYKMKFTVAPTDVPGLWDMPLKKYQYRGLRFAHRMKRRLSRASEL